MDDIVTRLRATAEHYADLWLEAVVTEAADEIEALNKFADEMEKMLDDCRRERDDLRKQLDQAISRG